MGETGNSGKAKRTGTSLDGVCGTENQVNKFRVFDALAEIQQRIFHGLQAFEAFLEKDLMKLADVNGHQRLSQHAFNGRQQLVRVEGFYNPAGCACSLTLLFLVRA